MRSAILPPGQGADGPQNEEHGQRRSSGGLGFIEHTNPVQGNKRIQSEEDDRATEHQRGQPGKWFPLIGGRPGGDGSSPRSKKSIFGTMQNPSILYKKQESHACSEQSQNGGSLHPQQQQRRSGHDGTESESYIAAHGKNAESCALSRSGESTCHARALGMKNGIADTTQAHSQKQGPVTVQKAYAPHADAGKSDPKSHEPGMRMPVCEVADQRLHNGRSAVRRENQPRCGSIVEIPLRHEKRQDGRQRALIQIREDMPRRKQDQMTIFHAQLLMQQWKTLHQTTCAATYAGTWRPASCERSAHGCGHPFLRLPADTASGKSRLPEASLPHDRESLSTVAAGQDMV